MNTIREIGISICVTAVAAAIFQGLIPKSNLEKTIRFVLSVFLLSCLIVPLTQLDFSSLGDSLTVFQTDDHVKENNLQDTVNQKLTELTEESVAQTMRLTLEENGIEVERIQVETTIEEDNSIMINRVIISVQTDDYQAASELADRLTNGDETRIEFCVSE